MKKFLYAFFAMILATATIFVCSCSSDDDDNNVTTSQLEGEIDVAFEGASTFHYYTKGNTWLTAKSGAYSLFYINMSDNKESLYFNDVRFSFQTKDALVQGTTIAADQCNWRDWDGESMTYYSSRDKGKVTGDVYIKSINGNKITLQFKNLKFDRISKFIAGASHFQYLTFNGEVTLTEEVD